MGFFLIVFLIFWGGGDDQGCVCCMSGFGIGVWGWDRGFGIEEGGEEEGEWTGRGRRRGGRGDRGKRGEGERHRTPDLEI